MSTVKEYLTEIVSKIDDKTTLEEVYELLALLEDVDTSEREIEKGNLLKNEEAKKISQQWLK